MLSPYWQVSKANVKNAQQLCFFLQNKNEEGTHSIYQDTLSKRSEMEQKNNGSFQCNVSNKGQVWTRWARMGEIS